MTGTVWECFTDTVRRNTSRPAIECGGQVMTFGEWRDRAAEYLTWLHQSGARRHDRVLLCMNNSTEMAAALAGIWGAGCIPALLSADAPRHHIEHAIEAVDPVRILVDEPLLDLEIAPERTACPLDVKPCEDVAAPVAGITSTEPASIVFTSGSTGPPKGVVQTHGALIRGCRAVAHYLATDADDRILCPIPWSFDYGFGQLLSTLVLGATQILPEAPSPFALCRAIEQHRPTTLPGIPSLFAYLLQGMSPFGNTDISSLRTVVNTGGTIPGPVLKSLLDLLQDCRLSLSYGLTESYRTSALDPALAREHPTSIGRGIPGVQAIILREDGTPTEPGEEGEIVHRGDTIFQGYWNDPETTARVRRPDPLAPEDDPHAAPVLFTGDFGHRDEHGLLYFHGRRDRLLKTMGVRVNPNEIEQLIHDSGLVLEVAVFGQKHDLIGDEIWAAVAPALGRGDNAVARSTSGTARIESELGAYARRVMSPSMTPRRFLVRHALPRTPSGKIDYPALEKEAAMVPSAPIIGSGVPRAGVPRE